MRMKQPLHQLVLAVLSPIESTWCTRSVLGNFFCSGLSILIAQGCLATEQVRDTAWTEQRRTIAETWRVVDNLYLDRTFNGKDWFKVRQSGLNGVGDESAAVRARGMLAQLGDKYTRYLTPSEYEATVLSTVGHLVGVGVELERADLGDSPPVITNVADGSPAALTGLRAGDLVVNVDGAHTATLSPEEVSALMRGQVGTAASVRVRRQGHELDFVAHRQPLSLRSVIAAKRVQVDGRALGYVQLRSFSVASAPELSRALTSLQRAGRMDALVLDLRDNAGGLLQGAVDCASLLLKPGSVVVHMVGKEERPLATKVTGGARLVSTDTLLERDDPGQDVSAEGVAADYDTPLFVWVNRNTASSAEVLAAALKENGRATLVGEQSFGKGVVQRLQALSAGRGAVAVTYARYETPAHRDIHKVGLAVDHPLVCAAGTELAECLTELPLPK